MAILIDNIMNLSRKFNRGVCAEYDNIVRNITAQSETTEQLVKQQEYVDNLPVRELLTLKVGLLL